MSTDTTAPEPSEDKESHVGNVETKPDIAPSAVGTGESKVADSTLRQRDVPVSTVVRLMGLPTSADMAVLESKVDIMSAKVATIGVRVERIATQLMEVFHDFDRFDVQIADMREFIKQSLTSVIGKMDSLKDSSPPSPNGSSDSDSAPKAN